MEGDDGALYGTRQNDGSNNEGSVFKLEKDGSGYIVLYRFNRIGGDGASPAGLVEGRDGALYGTTADGGSNYVYGGTVFKLNKDGSGYSVLRSFSESGDDGQSPHAGLVEGSDGVFYGTTAFGGTDEAGTVFELNKDGSGYSVLHRFNRIGGDGVTPVGALVQGSNGALYGTTAFGGTEGAGTVFRLNTDGSGYSVLRSFNKSGGDGTQPEGGLVEGSDGSLYGTTVWGGMPNAAYPEGAGTVFKLFSSTPIVAISRIELDGAGARLCFSGGAAGQRFRIETKTGLNAPLWQTIATNQFGIDGKFQFLDTGASNYASRFYRSATP